MRPAHPLAGMAVNGAPAGVLVAEPARAAQVCRDASLVKPQHHNSNAAQPTRSKRRKLTRQTKREEYHDL